jgi:hypothetical protein
MSNYTSIGYVGRPCIFFFFQKVWWPYATLFSFIFLYTIQYIHSYNHTSFIHKHSLRPISISSQLSAQWAEPPWGAEPRFELGPALQQASALPTLRYERPGRGAGAWRRCNKRRHQQRPSPSRPLQQGGRRVARPRQGRPWPRLGRGLFSVRWSRYFPFSIFDF